MKYQHWNEENDKNVSLQLGSSQTGRVPGGSSQTGGFVSGVGAPAYLSIEGYERCLEEYTPTGSFVSILCLPKRKPFSCNRRSWTQLQQVFQEQCPKTNTIGGKNNDYTEQYLQNSNNSNMSFF